MRKNPPTSLRGDSLSPKLKGEWHDNTQRKACCLQPCVEYNTSPSLDAEACASPRPRHGQQPTSLHPVQVGLSSRGGLRPPCNFYLIGDIMAEEINYINEEFQNRITRSRDNALLAIQNKLLNMFEEDMARIVDSINNPEADAQLDKLIRKEIQDEVNRRNL